MDRKAMGLTRKRGLTKGDHRLQPIPEIWNPTARSTVTVSRVDSCPDHRYSDHPQAKIRR
jgi:hypothetical protein